VVGAGREIGDAFVEHAVPRMISFTGSTDVGKHIAQLAASGPHLKRVVLELGGNSPFVVLDDADLDQAVAAAIFGKFLHQGQICMAINRIIVDASLYDAFVDRFVQAAGVIACGDPDLPTTLVGPIINHQQHDGLRAKIARAKDQSARLVLGGPSQGLLMPPHVFADVTADMAIAVEETFGPVAAILRAKNEEDALAIANDSQYGLSAAVFTGDIERGNRFAQRIDAGMTHVNDIPVQDQANAPFGGEKNSGIGRYGADWVLEEFTRTHWISLQHQPRHFGN
jgi:aldehyde dehydrogenase (NAD+)